MSPERKQGREVREGVTKFDAVKAISDVEKFAELVYDLVNHAGGKAQLAELLKKELSEKELQTLTSIAQKGYPLSLEGMQ